MKLVIHILHNRIYIPIWFPWDFHHFEICLILIKNLLSLVSKYRFCQLYTRSPNIDHNEYKHAQTNCPSLTNNSVETYKECRSPLI